jgi:hypothetical protein
MVANTPAFYTTVIGAVKVLLHKLPQMLNFKQLAEMKNESSLAENSFFSKRK